MRFNLLISIPIILFIIIYVINKDDKVSSNLNTLIEASTDLYKSQSGNGDTVLPAKKNKLTKDITNVALVVPEAKKRRQYSQSMNKGKIKKVVKTSNINEVEDIPQDLVLNMNKLFTSAKSKNWDEFNQAVEFLDIVDQQTLNLALFQATINDAPINIIKDLLNKGASFSFGIINMLAMQNNITLIKKLIPLGLNIYTTDKQGQTAIYYTLLTFNAKKTFDFLINSNVNVNSSNQKSDPLDKALEYTINNKNGVYYVDKLINYGAQIRISHKKYLKQIKQKNNRAYIGIISRHPELVK